MIFEDYKKPTTWDLENKSDWELLNLVQTKLYSRTRRECEKFSSLSPLKDTVLWKKARSKFYAHWYALDAIDIYMERKEKVTKISKEKHEHHWQYKNSFEQYDGYVSDGESMFFIFVCVCGRLKKVKQVWDES
jgi:hypothetical protein